MPREGVPVEVYRRKFTVDREDLDPLQVVSVAKKVEERMRELERATGVVDSSRLAIMTALELACDMEKLQGRLDHADLGHERRIEELIVSLDKALRKKP